MEDRGHWDWEVCVCILGGGGEDFKFYTAVEGRSVTAEDHE